LHKPVLLETVLSYLKLKPGDIVLDGTVGSGGHAEAILKVIGSDGFLIGLDQDEEAIKRTQSRLEHVDGRFKLFQSNFRFLDQVLSSLNFNKVNAVLLDVGVSTDQLEVSRRGFSFQQDGPLDMRMDQGQTQTAADLVNGLSQEELTMIFRQYGEERYARQIAQTIVRGRASNPFRTTGTLKKVVEEAVPTRYRYGRIHPATRVFQALRIAVNDELAVLEETLPKAFDCLEFGGKLCIISFHSLEDRIVKHFFVKQKAAGTGKIITKKPVQPNDQEIESNPKSRSAKLRVIERN